MHVNSDEDNGNRAQIRGEAAAFQAAPAGGWAPWMGDRGIEGSAGEQTDGNSPGGVELSWEQQPAYEQPYSSMEDPRRGIGPPPNPSVIGYSSSGDEAPAGYLAGGYGGTYGGSSYVDSSSSAYQGGSSSSGYLAGGDLHGGNASSGSGTVSYKVDSSGLDPGAGVGQLLEPDATDSRKNESEPWGHPAPAAVVHADQPQSASAGDHSTPTGHADSSHQDSWDAAEPDLTNSSRTYYYAYHYAKSGPAYCPIFISFVGVVVMIATTVAGLIAFPIEIDTDFDSFMKTDVNSSTMRDAFLHALTEREDVRRLQGATDLFKLYDVYIAYEMDEEAEGHLMEVEHLRLLMEYENKFRELPKNKEFCNNDMVYEVFRRYCNPGVSVLNFAMPQLDVQLGEIVPESMVFNGQGKEVIPMQTLMRLAEDYKIDTVTLPTGIKKNSPQPRTLRSAFRFKLYCCSSADSPDVRKSWVATQDAIWKDMVRNTFLPFFEENNEIEIGLSEASETPKKKLGAIKIWYDGTSFQGVEVMVTLANDNVLAIGSMVVVLAYLLFHTRSMLLSLMGIFIITISVPLSYVVFALITQSRRLSIASFLSLFLIIGLGSDVVFVYTDFWRDSLQVKDNLTERVAWTYLHAGKATLATTATTAISFMANLASVLKPLREFGMFMGLCVLLAWVLLTLVFVPLCVVDDVYFSKCRLASAQPGTISKATQRGNHRMIQIVRALHFRKRLYIGLPSLIALIMLIWAAAVVETDTSVPNIFPEDHNQNRGKAIMSNFRSPAEVFDPLFPPPPKEASVCSETEFDAACPLYWCEVAQGHQRRKDGQCECYRQERPARGTCGQTDVALAVTRVVGPDVTAADLEGPIGDYLDGGDYGVKVASPRQSAMQKQTLTPTLINEWESGALNLRSTTEIRSTVHRNDVNYGSCGWQEICFCGTHTCKMPSSWRRTFHDPIVLQAATELEHVTRGRFLQDGEAFSNSSRRLGADIPRGYRYDRRLQESDDAVGTVSYNLRAWVEVIFGMEVVMDAPLVGEKELDSAWNFQITYEARQPWAQRNMLALCQDIPKDMLVMEKRCWIEHFQEWIKRDGIGERFPVPSTKFDSLVQSFAETTKIDTATTKDFMWLRNGEVKASFMSFSLDISRNTNTWEALKRMQQWDDYIDAFNRDASRFTKGAWHVAELWVRAQAQEALISSTVLTLVLVLVLAFLGMLIFTRDVFLSFYVVCATLSVISGLTWFITAFMAWRVGPVEAIALIVFIGYAVTYSLHIAHKYGSDDAVLDSPPLGLEGPPAIRFQRTSFAMRSIGGAAFGSAMTTAGCAVFLLFCKLIIFQKLGGVVLAVTGLSIFVALVPLPAALLLCGPLEPGCKSCSACSSPQEFIWSMEDNIESSFNKIANSTDRAYETINRMEVPALPKMPNLPKRQGPQPTTPPPPVPPPKFAAKAPPQGKAMPPPGHGPPQGPPQRAPQGPPQQARAPAGASPAAASSSAPPDPNAQLPRQAMGPPSATREYGDPGAVKAAGPAPATSVSERGAPSQGRNAPTQGSGKHTDGDFEIGVETSLMAINHTGDQISPTNHRQSPRIGGVGGGPAPKIGFGVGGFAPGNRGGIV